MESPIKKRLRLTTLEKKINFNDLQTEDNFIELSSSDEDEPELNETNSNESDLILDPNSQIYKCERIVKMRFNNKKNRKEYLLKWHGYSSKHNTWEPKENILCKSLLNEFKKRFKNALIDKRSNGCCDEDKDDKDYEQIETGSIRKLDFKEDEYQQIKRVKIKKKEQQKENKYLSSELNNQIDILKSTMIEMDENNNLFVLENVIKKNETKPRPIVVPENYDPSMFRVPCDKDTHKYMTGKEPKIIRKYVDDLTGEIFYDLKWKSSDRIDKMSADLALIKFPNIVELFNKR